MTPEQAKARAQRFAQWMEQDGLKDAIDGIAQAYIARIAKLDPTDSEFATKAKVLSIAAKVVEQVESHIKSAIADGAVAAQELDRLEKLSKLTKEQRRWL